MVFLSKLKYGIARIIWKVTKPITAGTRILLIKDNKVLLVKHTYQESLYLLGGGVIRGKTFEQAIRREMREELGAQLSKVKLFGVYNNFYESKNDSIVVFISDGFTLTGITDNEIESFDFFDLYNLPTNVSPGTRRRIEEYVSGEYKNFGRW